MVVVIVIKVRHQKLKEKLIQLKKLSSKNLSLEIKGREKLLHLHEREVKPNLLREKRNLIDLRHLQDYTLRLKNLLNEINTKIVILLHQQENIERVQSLHLGVMPEILHRVLDL